MSIDEKTRKDIEVRWYNKYRGRTSVTGSCSYAFVGIPKRPSLLQRWKRWIAGYNAEDWKK